MGETSGPEVIVYGSDDEVPLLLSAEEARVLGVLTEKQITTPDYYPLTLNALVNGCNQTSSRDPVVQYDELTVKRALDRLRDKKLAFVFSGADSRALKYGHKFRERLELDPAQTAALCVLLLRGFQTPGEIRTRSGRLYEFVSLAEVEAVLEALSSRQLFPLVTKLPRQAGFKESRFAHLLSGSPNTSKASSGGSESPAPTSINTSASGEETRIAQLEVEIAGLRNELGELRQQLADFRKQFE